MSIDEVLPGIYKVEIPLPKNPLKALNSYVVKAPGRNLIVDTAFNREECISATYSALEQLEVDLRATDFFITHLHADHSGLVSTLATAGARVFCSQPDAERINSTNHWAEMARFAQRHGFPEGELRDAIEKHPAYRYGSKRPVEFTTVRDGDRIDLGEYHFTCVHTPGHTMGHMCLYEPARKVLIAGDHVLRSITPNISHWSDGRNPLQEYLQSLDKICELEIDLVLPGHRALFRDCRERVQELKQHHQARADEALSILERGPMSAYQVASKMHWDLTYDSWEQFPIAQKWFATGEAVAHLVYLEAVGAVRQEAGPQGIVFRRC